MVVKSNQVVYLIQASLCVSCMLIYIQFINIKKEEELKKIYLIIKMIL